MAKEKDDLFTEENEAESTWASFDKVGDKYSGKLVDKRFQEGQGDFPDQHVYVLENDEGRINVGISVTKEGCIQRADQAAMGDTLGFEFAEEREAKTKGHQPFKLIKVYIKRNENPDIDSDDIDKAAEAFGEE